MKLKHKTNILISESGQLVLALPDEQISLYAQTPFVVGVHGGKHIQQR
jgi:hypothetical protein